MTFRLLASLGLLGALFATPVLAGTYKFTLHNESKYPITGFQTYEDGKWSTWSGVSVTRQRPSAPVRAVCF